MTRGATFSASQVLQRETGDHGGDLRATAQLSHESFCQCLCRSVHSANARISCTPPPPSPPPPPPPPEIPKMSANSIAMTRFPPVVDAAVRNLLRKSEKAATQHDFDSAAIHCRDAVGLLEAADDTAGEPMAYALVLLGRFGDTEEAIAALQRAITVWRGLGAGFAASRATCELLLAKQFQFEARFREALVESEHAVTSAELARTHHGGTRSPQLESHVAGCIAMAGDMLAKLGRPVEAVIRYEAALPFYKAGEYPSQLVLTMCKVCDFYCHQGQLDKALSNLERAETELASTKPSSKGYADASFQVLYTRGAFLQFDNRHDEAVTTLQRAIRAAKDAFGPDSENERKALIQVAISLHKLERVSEYTAADTAETRR